MASKSRRTKVLCGKKCCPCPWCLLGSVSNKPVNFSWMFSRFHNNFLFLVKNKSATTCCVCPWRLIGWASSKLWGVNFMNVVPYIFLNLHIAQIDILNKICSFLFSVEIFHSAFDDGDSPHRVTVLLAYSLYLKGFQKTGTMVVVVVV